VPVFPRKKAEEPLIVAVVPDKSTPKGATTPKKGKPTPKRSQAQAARRNPIVQSTISTQPQTKEEKAAAREKERAVRKESYEGMKRGEERHLSGRDKGAQRRFVRNFVDARWNLGEFFMPVAIGLILANYLALYFGWTMASALFSLLVFAVVVAAIVDLIIMWSRLKAALITKFGSVESGTAAYAAMRAMQLRRTRIPNPQHPTHGIYPS